MAKTKKANGKLIWMGVDAAGRLTLILDLGKDSLRITMEVEEAETLIRGVQEYLGYLEVLTLLEDEATGE